MTATPAPVPATRSHILVIEDEPSVAAFVRAALERHGYEVTSSSSAVEGLRLLALNSAASFPISARPEESLAPTCTIGSSVTGPKWLRELFLLPAIPPATRPSRCWPSPELLASKNPSAFSN